MPKIRLKISPVFLASFRDLVEKLSRQAGLQLGVQVHGPDDDDEVMLEAWRDGLIDSVREDCALLVSLFQDAGLGQRVVVIDEATAFGVLRACSAIRLKIQQLFLKRFPDEDLEMGELDFHQLDSGTQQAYACYIFLAGLQETLVHEIDPTASGE